MVNILRLTVAYLNATINVKPETQNRRLEPTGLAKPGETRGLTGTGPGLARQESAGRVFWQFWNWTDPFLRCKPGTLAGYPDPLLTLTTTQWRQLQVSLNTTRHAENKWSVADRQRVNVRLGCVIDEVTLLKRKIFNESLQHHEQLLLPDIWTKATGPRSTFTKKVHILRQLLKNRFIQQQTWPLTGM